MRTFLSMIAVAAVAACGGAAKNAPSPADVPATRPVAVAPPPPPTPEQLQAQTAAKYAECATYLNDLDKLAGCYADDAVASNVDSPEETATGPQNIVDKQMKPVLAAFSDFKPVPVLALVNGTHVASVALLTGTNDGAMMGAPPTQKKVGAYGMRVVGLNDDGKIVTDDYLADPVTFMGQLGVSKMPHRAAVDPATLPEPIVVVAKHDQAESDNLALVNTVCDAFNKHDVKTVLSLFANDAVWTDTTAPTDQNKKQATAFLTVLMKAFPDFQGTCAPWAAGDYVFNTVDWTATNTGAMPPFLKKATGKALHLHDWEVYQISGGKVTHYWRFANAMAMLQQLGLLAPPHQAGAPKAAKAEKAPKAAKAPKAPKGPAPPQVEQP